MGRPSERRRAPRGLDEAARRGRPRPGRAKKKKKGFPFDLFCVHSDWYVRSAPLRRHPLATWCNLRPPARMHALAGRLERGREGSVFVDEARSTAGSIDSGRRARIFAAAGAALQPAWLASRRAVAPAGWRRATARARFPARPRQPARGRPAGRNFLAFHPRAPARGARPATAAAPKTLAFRSERSQTGWLAAAAAAARCWLTDRRTHREMEIDRDVLVGGWLQFIGWLVGFAMRWMHRRERAGERPASRSPRPRGPAPLSGAFSGARFRTRGGRGSGAGRGPSRRRARAWNARGFAVSRGGAEDARTSGSPRRGSPGARACAGRCCGAVVRAAGWVGGREREG